MDLKDLLDSTVDVVLTGGLAVEDLDGERSTRDGEFGGAAVEVGELRRSKIKGESALLSMCASQGGPHLSRVHGGRCDDELEVATSCEDCEKKEEGQSRTLRSEKARKTHSS
jgi:hypothetical protein